MVSVATVAVEGATTAYDRPYTYLAPGDAAVRPGMRVRVPFGRAGRDRTAVVLETGEAESPEGLKPLSGILDPEPVLNKEGIALLHWLREHTFCTWYDALRLLVPAGLGIVRRKSYAAGNLPPERFLSTAEREVVEYLRARNRPVRGSTLCKKFGLDSAGILEDLARQGVLEELEDSGQAVRDERVAMVRLLERPEKLTPKQKAVWGFLEEKGQASLKEVCYFAACTRAVVDGLLKKGAVEYVEQRVMRSPLAGLEQREAAVEPPRLSEQQQTALDRLCVMLDEDRPEPALLYGVTGSGKTQVYLALVREALDRGKTALVMVPEIALTSQAVEDFYTRFGRCIAVLHSALAAGERMDEWRRIRSGEARIVVGTRSAVFAPLENLGLIVMDEEQEHTYKSEQSPRFHAREVARLRCATHGALLVLASATPSIEAWHGAKTGRIRLVELPDRYGPARLPDVLVVDMQEPENLSEVPAVSRVLKEELARNLEGGEQSILLLNRRGYSTVVKCSGCQTVADCPNCSVALTWHQANRSMVCHYCGYMQPAISACGHCGSELIRYAGAGTQKLEEELAGLFPAARVLRVDMDTTMNKFSHQKLFGDFLNGEYDIMVGTQMVAKGLNFPAVTLVGVLNADQSLYGGDFRSFERSFSLLTQVVGRGGRGEKRGRALIQTWSPESHVIRLAADQDYPAFYEDEIMMRKIHLYPPFCTLAGIGFVGEDLGEVERWSGRFLERFTEAAARDYADLPVRLLGPVPSGILRAAGKYRYKLVLKCRNSPRLRRLLRDTLDWFCRESRQVHAFVDMYYDGL